MKKAPRGVLVCQFLDCPLLNLLNELSVVGCDKIKSLFNVLDQFLNLKLVDLPAGVYILLVAFPCDESGSAWTGELSFFLSYLATLVCGDGDLGN